jgi:type I restriction enzyme S subunit
MKAEQLRKAILQMAIQGKLVPQDPTDEPASLLLEKIRSEKQRLIKEGKIKKDKVDSVIFKGVDNRHYEKVGNGVKDITDEIDFDLPDGWALCRLKSISYISAGGTPERSNPKYWEHGNIPWLKISDITSSKKYVNHSTEFITQAGVDNSSAKIMNNGTILYTIFATIGEVGILNFESTCNQAIAGVMPYNKSITEYLYYYLVNLQDFMKSISKGCAQFNINQKILKSALVPLPPLAEQQRIVAEIEKYEPLIEEYDKLEQAKSKLDGEIYDKLKKSILQYAIQGKLVPQDENDEPASELLMRIRAEKKAQLGKKYVDSYIYTGDDNCYYEHIDGIAEDEAIETPFDLPNNWAWVRWGDLSYSIQYGYNAPAKERGRIKMVRISDIHDNTVDWTNVPFCDIDEKDINTYLLKTNDILFARTGGTVGKSYLVTDVPEDAIYAGYLIRTRYSSELAAQYLKYFMESSLYWVQLREGTIATAQPNCNGQTLSKMLMPIPPLAEQQRIVDKINEIFAKL